MRNRHVSSGAAAIVCLGLSFLPRAHAFDDPPAPRPRPFRIQVVEAGTGRGVPLVELKTVNQIRYYTDSNGIVAFDEPGLFNQKVYFSIRSHGYEVDKDGFGYRGAALLITEGGKGQVVIHRLNIARRLYRVTGEGIYRDSILTGDKVPIREPILNGQVFGQDSVVNAVFQGKIYWFWGDTNRPDYPLGNFHVPGAVSELPGRGGLEPQAGVDLSYFVDEKGFAVPTAPMPGEGPDLDFGAHRSRGCLGTRAHVRVLRQDPQDARGLRARARRVQSPDQPVRASQQIPRPGRVCRRAPRRSSVPAPGQRDQLRLLRESVSPLRVPADPERLKDRTACEAYTCLVPGSRFSQQQLDRTPDGRLRYGWKTNTQLVRQDLQAKLIASRRIAADESLLNLRDIDSGKPVQAHGGSVYWNAYRNRWVMITVESFGSSSALGEIWYAEADSPLGPWVYGRKVVTHDKYSFYNPKHHPMLDRDLGRIIFFEGTYTTTFSGNPDPTPRYDYNQVMYQLDLSDPRLALPVAIYQSTARAEAPARLAPKSPANDRLSTVARSVAFFAPDREGIATLPVYEEYDVKLGQTLRVGSSGPSADGARTRPLFFILPAAIKDYTSATTPLYELTAASGAARVYTIDSRSPQGRTGWTSKVLGRVWKNPASLVFW